MNLKNKKIKMNRKIATTSFDTSLRVLPVAVPLVRSLGFSMEHREIAGNLSDFDPREGGVGEGEEFSHTP